jgi:hypothetical protein
VTAQIVQYAADRPLMIADVVSYAKKDCGRCHGAGFYVSIFHKGAPQESREPQACRCTHKRFSAEHGNDLVLVNGAPFWKPGKAPRLPGQAPTPTTAPTTG